MLITYFRSSSYNAHSSCEQDWFMQYNLGWKGSSGLAASKGTIAHKILEILAIIKKGQQDGLAVVEDKIVGVVPTEGYNLSDISDKVFGHYSSQETQHNWSEKDLKECKKWVGMAMDLNGGMFNPLQRHIVAPEIHFDFPILKDWARYSYNINGEAIEGHLSLKGTVDLVTQIGEGVYEVIDWKTGAYRKDWATGKVKEHEDFQKDPQLMFYYYALSNVFPEIEQIMLTIYFIRAGGPYSVIFTKDDLPKVEDMLRKKFEAIKKQQMPKLTKTWKCSKTCYFGKNTFEGTGIKPIREFRSGQVTRKGELMTMCEQVNFENQRKGLDRVMKEYKNPTHNISDYKAPGEAE